MKTFLGFAVAAALCAGATGAAYASDDRATKAQTERWLTHHIESWDDQQRPRVRVRECVIQRTTTRDNHILNLTGLILPVEVLDGGSNDAVVRARVQDVRSGNYAMSRQCDDRSRNCAGAEGNYEPEPYVDFMVRHAAPYTGNTRSLTSSKATQLQRALVHYARLCNDDFDAMEENIRF